MALSPSQRRYLRSLAHDLHPVILLGAKGATDAVVKELDQTLSHHELVKVKLSGGDKEEHIDAIIERAKALLGPADYRTVFDLGLDLVLADIRQDLEEFGVVYDQWYSERSLAQSGAVQRYEF